MPDPKIARRCSACGASIRKRSLFCPQCGENLRPKPAADKPNPPTTEAISFNPAATLTESEFRNATLTESDSQEQQKPDRQAMGEAGPLVQRATTRGRDVEGDVKQRVQRLRDISNVVIDEAGYDPSLRFVLVAAGLFVLFLIIMLLNKLIG